MKHFALCLAVLLLISNFSPACAAEEKTITVTDFRAEDDSFLQICVGEEAIRFLSSDSYGLPYLDENSRIQIPVRRFTEATGGSVEYHHEDLSVTITYGDDTVVFVLGSNIMTYNGIAREMDTTAQNIGGRTYIPLRAIAEALEYTVEYAREAAKSPECRIAREGVASMRYNNGGFMRPTTQEWHLTERDLDIIIELYNQMCMSSSKIELDTGDTVSSYRNWLYGKLKSGQSFDLCQRGPNEVRIWVEGAEVQDWQNYLMTSKHLYDYLMIVHESSIKV